jgi:hypothetical protein
VIVDEVTVSGADLNPYWPDPALENGQKEGDGTESYEVQFDTSSGEYSYSPADPEQFSQFSIGSEWLLSVNALNAVVSVEPAR